MKLFLKFGSAIVVCVTLAFYFNGCVKVDNPVASSVDIRTSVKFVDLANNGSTMSVSVDGISVGSFAFQNYSGYVDLPAGGRKFAFTYGTTVDTVKQAIAPDYKSSFFSIQQTGDTSRTYAIFYERVTYSGAVTFVPRNVLVRFINLSSDTATTIKSGVNFHLTGVMVDTVVTDSSTAALGFLKSSSYIQAPLTNAPKYYIVGAQEDTLVSASAVSLSEGRYSVVLYGSKTASNLQSIILKED
ncbi:MAG: hypothetical protein ABSA44_11290 [Bacteroidota bacterium]